MKINRKKLNIILATKEMTITDVAEKAGISRARAYSILNSVSIFPATAGRIANALEVDVAELLEEE